MQLKAFSVDAGAQIIRIPQFGEQFLLLLKCLGTFGEYKPFCDIMGYCESTRHDRQKIYILCYYMRNITQYYVCITLYVYRVLQELLPPHRYIPT